MDLQIIQDRIFTIRGQRVMLDFHLAEMYEVQTKNLNLAVKRNSKRFPSDFMFQLTTDEWNTMRLQFETASQKKRNISALPYAFTEQGLAMLSGILNSDKAIDVNVAIMRAFVMLRRLALHHKDILERIDQIEAKYDEQFAEVFQALKYLLEPPQTEREPIGFKQKK
jgi:ORF6N domain